MAINILIRRACKKGGVHISHDSHNKENICHCFLQDVFSVDFKVKVGEYYTSTKVAWEGHRRFRKWSNHCPPPICKENHDELSLGIPAIGGEALDRKGIKPCGATAHAIPAKGLDSLTQGKDPNSPLSSQTITLLTTAAVCTLSS